MSADAPPSPASAFPTRFREAEERNTRLARPLKLLGRVDGLDERLMTRIGLAFGERDEIGAALADAIRTRAEGQVSSEQLRTALHEGVAAIDDPPRALAEFFAGVEGVPDWLDWDLVNEGAAVFERLGQNAADVLLQVSLLGGYRFGGPTDLLVATGGLTGDMTRRRLAETQAWAVSLAQPDGLRPPTPTSQAGRAWRLTVHVRIMHALVNAAFEPRWDVERWGLPINQADQAATLGLFDGALILGCRALGVRIDRADSRALMHLWRYVGHLMGVDPDFLVDDEWERHRINYHVLRAQADISAAGPQLAQAILAAQGQRRFGRLTGGAARLRGRLEQERLLSMLTVFLGPGSVRELGLAPRPPWATAYVIVLNLLRYHLVGRTHWGRRLLRARGRRVSRRILDSYFAGEPEGIGPVHG